jgi:hypothetical protein
VLDPTPGEPCAWCCYGARARPAEGRVVAIERIGSRLNPGRVVAWEYLLGRGRVMCLGAFAQFATRTETRRPALAALLENALRCTRDPTAERSYWPPPGTAAAPSESLPLPDPPDLDAPLPEPSADPMALDEPVESDEPFDLSGRRALVTGSTRLGIREIRLHPHRAALDYGVVADGEPALGSRLETAGDVVQRTLASSSRRLVETVFAALEHPVVVLEYRPARRGRESVGRGPAGLELSFTVDLWRGWPFPPGSAGNLVYRRSPNGLAGVVACSAGDGAVALMLSREAGLALSPAGQAGAPAVQVALSPPLGHPFRLVLAGGADLDDLERVMRAFARLGLAGLVRQRTQRSATLSSARLVLRAPNEKAGRAAAWALRRLDGLLIDVPRVGRSLSGAFDPARPPSLASREACWAGSALLAAGEHSVVRQVLRFLGDRQDAAGRVPRTASPSGLLDYEAADSNPMFLWLAARYLEWTGDTEFLSALLPRLERALAEGHALGAAEGPRGPEPRGSVWPDVGPASARAAEPWLLAWWRIAFEGIGRAAETLGAARLAADCWASAARVGTRLDAALAAGRHGSRTPAARSALAAPLIALGAFGPGRARRLLDQLTGARFRTGWGVRLLADDDPDFDPDRAVAGGVWPALSGWTALALYRAGRGEAGFDVLWSVLSLAFARQLGAFDEVLHGRRPLLLGAGNSAGAAALALTALVEGLLGAVPEAPKRHLTIAPRLPAQLDWLEFDGLRCGESSLDLRLRARPGLLDVNVRRSYGPPLGLTVAPWVETAPERVEVDGETVAPRLAAWGSGTRAAITLLASAEHELRFVL